MFNSEIPVISAVGHTEDVSICDFTADVCAKTPTEAGKLITDTFQLKEEILDRIRMLDDSIEGRVISERRAVEDSMRLLSSEIRSKIRQLKMEVYKIIL